MKGLKLLIYTSRGLTKRYEEKNIPPGKEFSLPRGQIAFRDNRWWLIPSSGRPELIREFEPLKDNTREFILPLPPETDVIRRDDRLLIIHRTRALNMAHINSGLGFIKRIGLINLKAKPLSPGEFTLSIGKEYTHTSPLPGLEPGIPWWLRDFPPFPGIFGEEEKEEPFTVTAGGVILTEEKIKIMSSNSWLRGEESSTTLAAFVLPGHSYINTIISRLESFQKKTSAEKALEELYTYFTEKWEIRFSRELGSGVPGEQKIRLPQHILYDWETRKGEGTCLDLALLLAGALEQGGYTPLICVLEISSTLCHALVGCRTAPTPFSLPLVKTKKEMEGHSFYVDPNGLPERKTYAEARKQGETYFRKYKLLFVLDIHGAREFNINPLPFREIPRESSRVIQADRAARNLARTLNPTYQVCTSLHMLLALLESSEGFVPELFITEGINPETAGKKLKEGLRNIETTDKVETLTLSRNYRLLLSLGEIIATEEKSLFIREEHLLLALLDLKSTSLEKALKEMGLNRKKLRQQARSHLKGEQGVIFKSIYNNKQKDYFF